MQIRELSIPDSFEVTPTQHADDRGVFLEWYRFDKLEEHLGHPLTLRQANTSVSRRAVVRGIHFADVPLGQAKYVTVNSGAILDFIIDIRVGSETFGKWESVLLDDVERKAVYLAEGLGHLFLALSDKATVSYLVSDIYRPGAEHGINPLDVEIGLKFPIDEGDLIFSDKDKVAPRLSEAKSRGLLPTFDACRDFYASLNREANK
ncbi:MAG: dTDP-4-dehydrorhamnose 3,5-epimerase family protein [Microbacteriaceae bacterium]|nr:dTDP-4-dehydrorhamnose 3,5-epimerase family protein [Microbacteriaceae bacterium]